MAPAPLPPHERPWRHPSELAPTVDDVDHGTNSRGIVLVTGTAAVALAAVMVLTLTPPRSSAPTAISATTVAVAARQQDVDRSSLARTPGVVRMSSNAASIDSPLTLTGAPKNVASTPEAGADQLDLAGTLPAADETIYVLTTSHAFRIRWSEINRIAAPDGAVIVTAGGELVAEYTDGALVVLVD